ncbi:MAG: hypothetical protein OXE81_10375 [Gammaproteobacteria bacterium]|nr:hypothetical protein [Gammaproteobacteria bacterium]
MKQIFESCLSLALLWAVPVAAHVHLHVNHVNADDDAASDDIGACESALANASYVGRISGYWGQSNEIKIVLTGAGVLEVTHPDDSGCFAFGDVSDGRYVVKVSAPGYRVPAREVHIPFDLAHGADPYLLEQVPSNPFVYRWEEDQATPSGAEYSSQVVRPRLVEFQSALVEVDDAASAERLRQRYNILLTGDGWTQAHAFRLLTTMESIPQEEQSIHWNQLLPASAWHMTDAFIDGDIEIESAEDGTRSVTVSSAAFVNSAPRLATVDGRRGVWFSRRLHHAAVRFVTDNGHDEIAYERIFQERFGVTTRIDDYWTLTAPTGQETHHNFQKFHADEILLLLNMLEEMPSGMHKVEGLRFLVRRLDGLRHPLYPEAPAVAWPQSHYVEFMESAFQGKSEDYMHRLILHEKAHFLWAHLFDDRLKADWIELGGWYQDASSESGWYTTKSVEFVSAYAHLKNPDEDMAETIAFFVINPDRLRARSQAKYEFVRDRIMQGDIYVAQIREDLTFEVYNLFPDYVYPGKIRAVDITVEGAPDEDKMLTVEIELHALDLEKEGATYAQARISSEIGTYFDLWFYPIDEHGNRMERGTSSTRLRGTKTISKYAKAGYWLPNQMRLDKGDSFANSRYARVNDFGWKMYVDNALEDYTPPRYVAGSLSIDKHVWEEDDSVQVLRLDWLVDEDNSLKDWSPCFARIDSGNEDTYSFFEYGQASEDDRECRVEYLMPNYMPSGRYAVRRIGMRDAALNLGQVEFTGEPDEEPPAMIDLMTTNPDSKPPEIDVNRISVHAEPTNPVAPNGETRVTVRVRYRDDISGVRIIRMYLRDPQGGMHHSFLYDHRYDGLACEKGIMPECDPSQWRSYEGVHILPPGSHPGRWGIAELVVDDRAMNIQRYNFVEVVHFEVDE